MTSVFSFFSSPFTRRPSVRPPPAVRRPILSSMPVPAGGCGGGAGRGVGGRGGGAGAGGGGEGREMNGRTPRPSLSLSHPLSLG